MIIDTSKASSAMIAEFKRRYPQAEETRYRELSEDAVGIAEGTIVSQSEYLDAVDRENKRGFKPALKVISPDKLAYRLTDLIQQGDEKEFWQFCERYK